MKKLIAVALMFSLFFCTAFAQKKGAPKTQKEKTSYSIGIDIGKNLKTDGIEVDQSFLFQGIKDMLNSSKPLMSESDMIAAMKLFQQDMDKKMQEKQNMVGEKNSKDGEAFLAANKNNEGVVTLPSGLQYKVLVTGNGPKPAANDTVKVHYRGTLIDGTEFDSSYKRGEPAEFPVGAVIKGWVEGIQLMPVGSKWQLFIPSNLAYGQNGVRQVIGPNSALIFEVELLSIK